MEDRRRAILLDYQPPPELRPVDLRGIGWIGRTFIRCCHLVGRIAGWIRRMSR